jgi:hypothetical protein
MCFIVYCKLSSSYIDWSKRWRFLLLKFLYKWIWKAMSALFLGKSDLFSIKTKMFCIKEKCLTFLYIFQIQLRRGSHNCESKKTAPLRASQCCFLFSVYSLLLPKQDPNRKEKSLKTAQLLFTVKLWTSV